MRIEDRRIGWWVRTQVRACIPGPHVTDRMPLEWPQYCAIWRDTVFDGAVAPYVSAVRFVRDKEVL